METSKALNRAAALCSRSEQCESDLRAKLTRWGVDATEVDTIIARLRRDGFIDDARYARAFVHDKFLYNQWGPVKLAAILRQKGIAAEATAEALEQFSPQDYRDTLVKLLRTKWRDVSGRVPRLARAALLRFAAGRGFDAGMAYRAVAEVMNCDDFDD